jgi:ferritin-like protein
MNRIDLAELDSSGDIRTLADEAGALDPSGNTRRDLVRRGVIGAGGVAAGSAALGLLSPLEAFAAATGKQKGAYSRRLGLVRRASRKPTANDVVIANYALTLEYLEAAFYAGAVGQNFPDADINAAAKVLAAHEAAHVKALKSVLGKAAVRAPKLNMTAVGKLLADQKTFITVAAQIEPVGTAAYAGAAPYLSNVAVTKAALSIHSVEANHAAYTAALVRQKGYGDANPVPNAFNPAFGFKKVIKIVGSLGIVEGPLQP